MQFRSSGRSIKRRRRRFSFLKQFYFPPSSLPIQFNKYGGSKFRGQPHPAGSSRGALKTISDILWAFLQTRFLSRSRFLTFIGLTIFVFFKKSMFSQVPSAFPFFSSFFATSSSFQKSCLSISVPQLDIENLNNQRKRRRRRREEEDSRVCISPSPLFSFLRSAYLRTCLRLSEEEEEEEGEMMMTTLPLPYFVSRPDGQKYFFFLLSAVSKMPSQQEF